MTTVSPDLEVVVGRGRDNTPERSRSWSRLARRSASGLWKKTIRSRWAYLAGPLVLLILWQFSITVLHEPANKIPAPIDVFKELGTMIGNGTLPSAMEVSIRRVALGLLLGIGIGSGLALLSGLTLLGERLIDSCMQMFRTMPVLALLPLFVLWFGIGEEAKVLLIAWAVTSPIYINLFAGIKNVDPKLVEAGQVLGLSRLGLIRQVILPGALPQFLTGLRLAMGVSWLVLVAAEEINATSGLGYLITTAESLMQTDVIFAALIVYMLLGLGSDLIVRLIERWALAWRSSYVNR